MTTRRVNLNTESVDNYLKAIFALGGPGEERVSSTALADRLGVSPASITNMLQKLAASPVPLVEYESRRGVRLSPAGKRRALEILRHHRLLETFLYEVLGYPIEEVHDDAERLEHFISERFEERIDAKLGRPKFDPHGHCIPALDGRMSKQTSRPLSEIEEDGEFLVDSVSDGDSVLLKRLNAHGIAPGVRLRVLRSSQGEFVLRASRRSKPLQLPLSEVSAVRIRSIG
ncbi:MAG TPA: metal-dependent transcriptional regulator [Acidobacteriaceae bacterium]|nr:metal-dependent transcriptional regulator [Acidobacteriaceae bacterium]